MFGLLTFLNVTSGQRRRSRLTWDRVGGFAVLQCRHFPIRQFPICQFYAGRQLEFSSIRQLKVGHQIGCQLQSFAQRRIRDFLLPRDLNGPLSRRSLCLGELPRGASQSVLGRLRWF